jgi:hypothetical protein
VAVEKLASEKCAKIKMRQEALQTIFFNDLDIFYPRISTYFGKKEVFQQPPLFSTVLHSSLARLLHRRLYWGEVWFAWW